MPPEAEELSELPMLWVAAVTVGEMGPMEDKPRPESPEYSRSLAQEVGPMAGSTVADAA